MNTIDLGKVLGREFQDQTAQNAKKSGAASPSFGEMLQNSVRDVNKAQTTANQAVADLATGQAESIHSTLIAMEKAGLSFKLMMQVRNKVLDAYREVMRMQV